MATLRLCLSRGKQQGGRRPGGCGMRLLFGVAALLLFLMGAQSRADEVRLRLPEPFGLSDADGRPVRSNDFPGRLKLVYFGYTHCADQCPTSISTMLEAIELMGPAGRHVQPLFI